MLLRTALASFYASFLRRVDPPVPPGSEMRTAYRAGTRIGAEVVLGDRPIEITLQRCWDALSTSERFVLLRSLLWPGHTTTGTPGTKGTRGMVTAEGTRRKEGVDVDVDVEMPPSRSIPPIPRVDRDHQPHPEEDRNTTMMLPPLPTTTNTTTTTTTTTEFSTSTVSSSGTIYPTPAHPHPHRGDQSHSAPELVDSVLAALDAAPPALSSAILHERDMYLAWSLQRSRAVNGSTAVVGVVGAAHVRGVVYAVQSSKGSLRFRDLVGSRREREGGIQGKIVREVFWFGVWTAVPVAGWYLLGGGGGG